ncbi:MAG: GNAT family N-acetyltransferase [Gammaproteobacteria bacterium]|nr:GNAT family N-acetyltransferase [Gammaproteobacteria bacterium]
MSDTITIRPASREDIPVVLEFIRDLARYEHLEHEVSASEAQLREALFGERRHAEVIFACSGGEPLGFALFFHNFSTFKGQPGIYLEDLFVRPQARGRGIGKRLLAYLARTAVERGCARLEWAVLDWNEPSIGFYRSLGAVPMDEWTVFRLTGDALALLAGGAAAES